MCVGVDSDDIGTAYQYRLGRVAAESCSCVGLFIQPCDSNGMTKALPKRLNTDAAANVSPPHPPRLLHGGPPEASHRSLGQQAATALVL